MREDQTTSATRLGEHPEVPICAMDAAQNLLYGADGMAFEEVTPNVWMSTGAERSVAYLGTGKHAGGIVLRPLFVRGDGGSWLNATTGTPAPAEMAAQLERAQSHASHSQPVRVLAALSPQQRCEAMAAIAESFAWSNQLRGVFQRFCQTMADLFGCAQAHMHLISADKVTFMRRASAVGKDDPLAPHDPSLPRFESHLSSGVGRLMWMMEKHYPIIMDYEQPHFRDEIPAEALAMGMRSAVSIPLLANDQLLGIVSLVYRTKTEWSTEDCEYLVMVGRLAGCLIRRLFDTKKAGELQVLNERKLLSTEIHENVSSLLGAVSINAAAALEALKEDDEELARQDLLRLESTAAETMRILRDEMFSLRINLENTDTLIEGMQESLCNFERNWGVATELSITGPVQPVVVPTQASLQLTRILNECLSNTLRHAKASTVRVEVRSEERFVSMEVRDDGCGFDVDTVGADHFGLKIMRERAHAAGGRFSIRSGSDGTTVRVEIPRRQAGLDTAGSS